MGNYYSDKTEEGIRLLWMQYDTGKMKEGGRLLSEAAKEGEADAYSFLARLYMGNSRVWKEAGFEADDEKCHDLLCQSVAGGSACGILTMLQFSVLSEEVEKLVSAAALKSAYEEVLRKAEGGHPLCQLVMGMCYYWGGYFKANGLNPGDVYANEETAAADMQEKAVVWFEKALYGGITTAVVNLYDLYLGEDALPADEEKLWKVMRFAAERGDPMWQNQLADMLFEDEQYTEALKWYESAAANGETSAWYDMGYQYERGIGAEVDSAKTIKAYGEGAKAGNVRCQTRFGKHLLWGKITAKDEGQAYQWFTKATMQGDEIAKMFKGHCLLNGLGVAKDVEKGTNLLIDALDFNYPEEGESQRMVVESQFDWGEDMMQLFWDLGNVNEYGLSVAENQASAGYYYYMVAQGGWPEGIEKMTHYKKNLFGKWKRIK